MVVIGIWYHVGLWKLRYLRCLFGALYIWGFPKRHPEDIQSCYILTKIRCEVETHKRPLFRFHWRHFLGSQLEHSNIHWEYPRQRPTQSHHVPTHYLQYTCWFYKFSWAFIVVYWSIAMSQTWAHATGRPSPLSATSDDSEVMILVLDHSYLESITWVMLEGNLDIDLRQIWLKSTNFKHDMMKILHERKGSPIAFFVLKRYTIQYADMAPTRAHDFLGGCY